MLSLAEPSYLVNVVRNVPIQFKYDIHVECRFIVIIVVKVDTRSSTVYHYSELYSECKTKQTSIYSGGFEFRLNLHFYSVLN